MKTSKSFLFFVALLSLRGLHASHFQKISFNMEGQDQLSFVPEKLKEVGNKHFPGSVTFIGKITQGKTSFKNVFCRIHFSKNDDSYAFYFESSQSHSLYKELPQKTPCENGIVPFSIKVIPEKANLAWPCVFLVKGLEESPTCWHFVDLEGLVELLQKNKEAQVYFMRSAHGGSGVLEVTLGDKEADILVGEKQKDAGDFQLGKREKKKVGGIVSFPIFTYFRAALKIEDGQLKYGLYDEKNDLSRLFNITCSESCFSGEETFLPQNEEPLKKRRLETIPASRLYNDCTLPKHRISGEGPLLPQNEEAKKEALKRGLMEVIRQLQNKIEKIEKEKRGKALLGGGTSRGDGSFKDINGKR